MKNKIIKFLEENDILNIEKWNSLELDHVQPKSENDKVSVKNYIKLHTKSMNGLYVYKDSFNNILYIGKAKPLTDRIYHHYKETFVQQSGDRSGRWFRFFNQNQGLLKIYWREIEDESVRVFIESILTDIYCPKFLSFEKSSY